MLRALPAAISADGVAVLFLPQLDFGFPGINARTKKALEYVFCALGYFFLHEHIKGLLRAVFCVLKVFKGLVLNFYRCDAFVFDFRAFLLLRSS